MAALLTGAFVAVACSDAPTGARSTGSRPSFVVNRAAETGEFEVCADGDAATFSVTATPLPPTPGSPNTTSASIPGGTCQIVFSSALTTGGYHVVVVQTSPAAPASISCTSIDAAGGQAGGSFVCSGGTSAYDINFYHGMLAIYTNHHASGCTFTFGYYKNRGSGLLPAGNFALSGQTYLQVLQTPPAGGNVYYILAHQYIAASVNVATSGGGPQSVLDALSASAAYFAVATPNASLPAGYTRTQITTLSDLLDSFNNGVLDPVNFPHCS